MSTGSRESGTRRGLRFRLLGEAYTILRFEPDAGTPDWLVRGEFTSISRTAEELSIVCAVANVPPAMPAPQRWACFKLQGPFPFSLTGILLSFIQPLSENAIPIFAVSTYDTDYVLVQEEFCEKALTLLREAGHGLEG